MDYSKFRQHIKILMIRAGYDTPGSHRRLAQEIQCGPTILSMALNGYREGPRYIRLLERVQSHLKPKVVVN